MLNAIAYANLFAEQMVFFSCAVQESVAVFRGMGGGGCVEVSLWTACCCQKGYLSFLSLSFLLSI